MKERLNFLLTFLIEILYTLSKLTVHSQPIDFTCVMDGDFAYNSCTQYVRCASTGTSSAIKVLHSCPSGTLFDNTLRLCDWNFNVICDSGSATTAVTSSQITAKTKSTDTLQQTTLSKCKSQINLVKKRRNTKPDMNITNRIYFIPKILIVK
jgi:hypothetical protein